ncbi:MAG: NAD-dependent epimerase/dehydratase family protein [Candidatus Lokiarchaeota archaeon]|nr:NAD-dependent epimerase/dehydratase family protein [Candidatus Lokiarchaeota archaeon]
MVASKVVVTGAAGFIGSNLCETLLKKNIEVVGIDNLYTGKLENLNSFKDNKYFKFVKCDIRNLSEIAPILKDTDVIFHEAAQTSVQGSIQNPSLCNEVNVQGTLNILDLARKNDVEKVILASSAAIYGDDPTLPKKESMHVQPISPYGVSKLAAESYLFAYYRVYGLKTTSLRYFNVYGPRQDNSPYSGVIAIFLSNIRRNKPINVFGDGTQTRDFVYVKDVVNANILASESIHSAGKILNIASGNPTSLNEVLEILKEEFHRKELMVNYKDNRVGDIKFSSANISLAKKIIGFEPKYDIRAGLEDYIRNYIA